MNGYVIRFNDGRYFGGEQNGNEWVIVDDIHFSKVFHNKEDAENMKDYWITEGEKCEVYQAVVNVELT